MKHTQIKLSGIMLLALVLRLIAIESRGLEYDDTFSFFLAGQPFGRIIAGTAADTMPPLYYFLLHLWINIGRQVWVLRLLNVLLSLGILVLIYQLTKRLFGEESGLWAAFFTAISPLQIFHAQGMRMYILLTLTLLGYLWFFTLLWLNREAEKSRCWGGLIICGALAMYSHNVAIFTLVAPNVFLALKRERRLLLRVVLAQLAIGALALPWLLLVPGQVAKVQTAFWTPKPGIVEVLQAIVMFHASLPVPGILLPIAVVVSVQALGVVVIENVRPKQRTKENVQLLMSFFLVPPVMIFITSYLMRPIFVPRVLMLSSIAYYALAGRAAANVRFPPIKALIVGLFALAALVTLPVQYTADEFPRSPLRQATGYLRQQTGDLILHDNKLSYFPAHFYAPSLPQVFLPDEPGSHNDTFAPASQEAMEISPASDIETAVGDAGRVWFVVFEVAISEYQGTGNAHPQLAWLEERFTLTSKQVFNDLLVYEFVR